MPITAYGIGTTSLNITALGSLSTPVPFPKSTFQPYMEYLALGSGGVRGAGFPFATWQYGYLTQAQRNMLRSYCSGAQATVYIWTRVNDNSDAYIAYQALMIWPLVEERDAFRRISFTIEFRNLVAV